jgi:hypothetical protein
VKRIARTEARLRGITDSLLFKYIYQLEQNVPSMHTHCPNDNKKIIPKLKTSSRKKWFRVFKIKNGLLDQ